MDEFSRQIATESQQDKRVKMTRIVSPSTVKRLETLETIFETKQGRIIDRLVQTLWESRATKCMHCVTGLPCRFQVQFPETNIL
jgi:predicted aldo/keto reductase-like oxidoreductase